MCVYLSLSVFYLVVVDFFGLEGYFSHLASKGKLVIFIKKVIFGISVRMIFFY